MTFNLCPATEAERQESESQLGRLEEENRGRARQSTKEGDFEDQEEEEEQEEQQEDEEARMLKRASDPGCPTEQEREAHEATHLPYRSWCAECVDGRKRNPPHRRVHEELGVVPEVGMDYGIVEL